MVKKKKVNKVSNLLRVAFLSIITALVLTNTFKFNFISSNNLSEIVESESGKYLNLEDVIDKLVLMIKINSRAIKTNNSRTVNNSKNITVLERVPIELMDSNVIVLGEKGMGSGSIIKIDEKGSYILTAAHVVSSPVKVLPTPTDLKPEPKFTEEKQIKIKFKNDKEYVAVIEKIDNEKDLAVLRIAKKLPVMPVKIAKEEPNIGEIVWSISNPGGTYGVINNGIFSTPGKKYSYVSIAGFFGSSGGMCLNRKGEQIGVISVVLTARMNAYVPSLTVYNGITRTKDLNDFLKGII